ncbi:MAG: hypothetical protein Kilf2KO_46700 [Rhodospirillales bacterium]
MTRTLTLLLCLLLPVGALAQDTPQDFDEARKMFRQFVLLEQSYNPDVIDFYADEADIYTTVILPNSEREFRTSGKAFKEALAPYLHTARNLGEWFAYSNITVVPEGNGMRVLASRTSRLSDETYPYQAYLARGPGGRWLIYEERSVVRPVKTQ